jgi:hypothetical protein
MDIFVKTLQTEGTQELGITPLKLWQNMQTFQYKNSMPLTSNMYSSSVNFNILKIA